MPRASPSHRRRGRPVARKCARVARRASAERWLCAPRWRRDDDARGYFTPHADGSGGVALALADGFAALATAGKALAWSALPLGGARGLVRTFAEAHARSLGTWRALSGTGYQDEPPDLAEASPLMGR